jgi:hypothetical protein
MISTILTRQPANLPPDVPPIDHVQAKHYANDDPPRLTGGERILLRDVSLTMGTPLAFVMDFDATMRARDHWLVIAEVWGVVVRIVIPVIVAIDETRHRQLPQIDP